MIARQLLFLFSALGAVNGIFTAAYLVGRRPRRAADCLLGALLLAVGVRTLKSTLLFFNPSLALEFRQLGLSACLLIGPLTYLYVRYALAELAPQPLRPDWRVHLGLWLAVIVLGVAFPYSAYPAIWDRSSYAIHAFWLVYLLATGLALYRARASWLLSSVYLGSWTILLAYATVPFTSYIVGALSFTFSLHIAVIVFLLRPPPAAQVPAPEDKYRDRKLTHDAALGLLAALETLMHEQRLHLNPDLTLAQLARRAGVTQAALSQALNDKLGKSFSTWVNEYRVGEAKTVLKQEPQLTLDRVAERCGFNASSTFFAAFKKVVGQTPAAYRAATTP